jgi:hypothetical protein
MVASSLGRGSVSIFLTQAYQAAGTETIVVAASSLA